ncbi:ribonuclease M5 [Mycoplasmoides fastidiosum]|uniref:Ribonuclease M5 n=1 Tax=Mycoplasmoides fastidiosum TaxID=92758 RepID=A0ABU0LZY7_9BACT|nr:ribonuclease M5 [Mycoplasmoides fastidiosum]MDQ0514155.1 ribonuclease M5 [Mycoplasmoides fastidiosum]UUD37437.1 ribonuclease M5 [Mycoplasmoides fastidiosum]
MNQKIRLDCVFVVEGKTDTSFIKQFFEVTTIETNGSELSQRVINLIRQIDNQREVILLLDPDYQGQKIQKRILEQIPNCKVCHFHQNDLSPHKIKTGIAEMNPVRFKQKILEFVNQTKIVSSLSWEEYLTLNLNSKFRRQQICDYFQIPYFNHKTLFKKFQLMGLHLQQIQNALDHE